MAVLPVLLVLLALLAMGAAYAVAVRVGRSRFCSPSSAFPCLVRSAGRLGRPEPGRWPRRRWRAVWAHDVLLRLDDDSLVEIATAGVHRHDLVGPFLAAAIPGLPRGPRERPNLGR